LLFVHFEGVDGNYRPLNGHDSRSHAFPALAVLTCALGPDCAGTLLTHFVESTRTRLDGAVYEVGPSYRWAFAAAARRGAAVRLLLDSHVSDGNTATAGAITDSGGLCRVLPRASGEGHWKVLVADGDRVAIGTGNLIWRDAPRDPEGRLPPHSAPLSGTREWWLFVSEAPRLARDLLARIERAWATACSQTAARAFDRGHPPERVGAPLEQIPPLLVEIPEESLELTIGGAAIAGLLSDRIRAATKRVLVTVPYVRTRDPAVRALLDALTAAQARGVEVRVLLGSVPQPHEGAEIRARGLPFRVMDPERSTCGHAKGAVVDSTAVVGSANWSSAGLGANWEAALAVSHPDASRYYARALLSDWEVALAFGTPARGAVSRGLGQGILGTA
jgi:cardiolipin synthase